MNKRNLAKDFTEKLQNTRNQTEPDIGGLPRGFLRLV
jgi:hypothetical protein